MLSAVQPLDAACTVGHLLMSHALLGQAQTVMANHETFLHCCMWPALVLLRVKGSSQQC